MQLYYIIFILIKMSHSELVPNKCAPGRGNIDGTCLKKGEITEIAKNNNIDSSKENILDEVKKTTGCDTDKCLVKHLNKDTDVMRPQQPKSWEQNSKEWLSSIDIDRVLSQYEKEHIDFVFYGPSPIDYDFKECNNLSDEQCKNIPCLLPELCKIKIEDLLNKEKKSKIGIVFNTDPHSKGGQHWFSTFFDLKQGNLYLFDSVGINIENDNSNNVCDGVKEFVENKGVNLPKRYETIQKLLVNVKNQGNQLNNGVNYKILYNTRQHQQGNSECGMYSIYFIVNMLKGKDFCNFNKQRITDNEVYQCRNKFFITDNDADKISNNLNNLNGGYYNFIISPMNKKKYLLDSKQGIQIVKSFVRSYLQ